MQAPRSRGSRSLASPGSSAVRPLPSLRSSTVSPDCRPSTQPTVGVESVGRSGQIRYCEDIVGGLAAAPQILIGMLTGQNFGKTPVRV